LSEESLQIEILFTSSKAFDPVLKEVTFAKYRLRSIPTARESMHDTHESLILEFQDVWKKGQLHSNPQMEGDYVISLLSLFNGIRVKLDSLKVNNVQTTLRTKQSSFLLGKMELPTDLEGLLKRLQSMDTDLLRQYLRSCNAYRTALSLIDENPTLSFFLLVTAIEAISNKVMRSGDLRKDFRGFILEHLPKSFEDELGKDLLLLLLEEAYAMRCAFTHGGKQISAGTLSADDTDRKYVRHYVDNKEVVSPSISWFSNVVQVALLGFLRDQKTGQIQESKLSDLAREEGVIHVKAAREIKAGQVLTTSDVDLDFQKKG
jgi:hypothetical protein